MSERVELAVIGAGPAGLEAALAAAEAGTSVVVIDRHPRPGGQYWRQLPAEFDGPRLHESSALLARLAATSARLLTDTLVWGAFPAEGGWQLTLHGSGAPHRLHAQTLILAAGAYDRPLALPGWTLPGVMTAGAAQTLLKSQRVLPGRRILLSGTGPLQLAAAAQLVEAGAEVVAVLEGAALPLGRGLRHLPALWGQSARLAEGWRYWHALRRAGAPLRFGWSVIKIEGESEVEAAVIAQIDDDWRPIPGSEQMVNVDTVLLGYGFTPGTQLTRLLGCEHDFNPARGGLVPRRDERLQTTCPGVFAVGDGAGIGGAELARIEGRIAGAAAAQRVDRLTAAAAAAVIAREQAGLAREWRFAAMLGALFTPGPGLYELATDDTIICRCEEVALAEIRAAVAGGAQTVSEVKGLTRCGMGNCQGRICGELVTRAVAHELGGPASLTERMIAAGAFSVRPPLEPLPLWVLADAAE